MFDEISSSDLDDFRANFIRFAAGSEGQFSEPKPSASDTVKIRLLDLLLNPDVTSDDNDFRRKIHDAIEKISQITALDSQSSMVCTTSDLLASTFEYKNQLHLYLDNSALDEPKRVIWRRYIDQFFEDFVLELVRRWEDIESDRHSKDIKATQKSYELLQDENNRLKGIYSLSIEIAKLEKPWEIYNFIATRLNKIVAADALIILDASLDPCREYIFPLTTTSHTEIKTVRNRLEDLFELFQRTVLNREEVDVRLYNSERVLNESSGNGAPESIFVPMVDKDVTWGLIGAIRKNGVSFNHQEVQALSIVTSIVDLVVRNINVLRRQKLLSKSMEDQIRFARTVQLNVLPEEFSSEKLSVKTRFKPSETISGDFYQFFSTGRNETGVVIGDVTGHGVAAGLMMMTVMGILTEVFTFEKMSVPEMFSRANQNISRIVNDDFFVTALAVWITADNRLVYINAGHPSGLLFKKSTRSITELKANNYPMGIFENLEIDICENEIESGDRMLLYTDGVIEAKNSMNSLFGLNRLKKEFTDRFDEDSDTVLDGILRSVYSHASSRKLNDDVALVLINLGPLQK